TEAFGGSSSEFNVHLSESPLARVMITVRTTPGRIPEYDVRAVEARLVAAARRWEDDLEDALIESLGEARGNALFRHFGAAFPAGLPRVWMHDLGLLAVARQADVEVDTLHAVFADAFGRVFRGDIESDDFNRLVVAARLPAEEIVILRAYAKYLRQIGFPLSQGFVEATLTIHADIARQLIDLFKLRFDPTEGAAVGARTAEQVRAIEAALEAVENLSEDRILRQYLALIQATTRTNFWRRDAAGRRKSFLSFKFDPSKVPGLPEPKPMFEIFVYS